MEKVKTLFIGTSGFAIPILEALAKADFIDLTGVVTQPDKPVGRKQELDAPPVKKYFLELQENGLINKNIPLFQPEKIRLEDMKILSETQPDLIIVASYGQILPPSIIDYPKYKSLNIHSSILPDLRGAVPMPMAILKGYKKTGVSIPVMTRELDNGDVVAVEEIELSNSETTETLTEKLAEVGAKKLIEILPGWIKGEIKAVPQDESKATYCYTKDISKEKAEIDFNKTAEEIDRMVRAFKPWPIAWFYKEVNGKKLRLKVYDCIVHDDGMWASKKPGEIFAHEKKLFAKSSKGVVELVTIQLEGKKAASGSNYLYLGQNK